MSLVLLSSEYFGDVTEEPRTITRIFKSRQFPQSDALFGVFKHAVVFGSQSRSDDGEKSLPYVYSKNKRHFGVATTYERVYVHLNSSEIIEIKRLTD